MTVTMISGVRSRKQLLAWVSGWWLLVAAGGWAETPGGPGAAAAPTPVAPTAELAARLAQCGTREFWDKLRPAVTLGRTETVAGLEAAREYFIRHQLPPGNFQCEYDMNNRVRLEEDDQVRQAAALWGLALLCKARPTAQTLNALVRGITFFQKNTREAPGGGFAPNYGEDPEVKTAAVAFLCLAITDFLSAQDDVVTPEGRVLYQATLAYYLNWLQRMEMNNGAWAEKYILLTHQRDDTAQAFCDSVCLLAYCRAARLPAYQALIPRIEAATVKLVATYTGNGWQEACDQALTRQFAPLGATALAEIAAAGWKPAEFAGNACQALAWWMLLDYEALAHERSPAGSAEVLLAALQVSRLRKQPQDQALVAAAQTLMTRALSCQVNGPLGARNELLQRLKPPKFLTGGVMTSADSGHLRIDMLQPVVHGLTLLLDLYFPDATMAGQVPPARLPGTPLPPEVKSK